MKSIAFKALIAVVGGTGTGTWTTGIIVIEGGRLLPAATRSFVVRPSFTRRRDSSLNDNHDNDNNRRGKRRRSATSESTHQHQSCIASSVSTRKMGMKRPATTRRKQSIFTTSPHMNIPSVSSTSPCAFHCPNHQRHHQYFHHRNRHRHRYNHWYRQHQSTMIMRMKGSDSESEMNNVDTNRNIHQNSIIAGDDGNDGNDDVNDSIDKLIIPDLSTLLSRATATSKISPMSTNTTHTSTDYIDQLAPAESIAYFYLQNTIKLPPDVMWKITNEAGSVLGFTVPNLKKKIAFLQRIMNLSDDDVRTIVSKQPSILHLSSNRNISSKVLFLVRYLDLSKSELRSMVVAYPCILCYSISNLQKKLSFFEDTLGFQNGHEGEHSNENDNNNNNSGELRELLVSYPKLLTAAVDGSYYNNLYHSQQKYNDASDGGSFYEEQEEYEEDLNDVKRHSSKSSIINNSGSGGLIAKFNFLHREIGIPRNDLKTIIKRNPTIMLYSLQNNIQPKIISLFIMRLRMNTSHICKLLLSFPYVMDYNMDNHLLPITRYFLTELEFSPMEFRSIVLKFPKIFSHSLFKVKHVVGYFRYQLGMNASQVKRILFQAPQVVSLNTDDTLVGKVNFIQDAFKLRHQDHDNDGDSDSDSDDNDDLSSDYGAFSRSRRLDNIRKVITGMPTLLLCSIENNLKPKAEYLLEEFGGDELELRQTVLTLPTLLGYSLEKRIKPRMARIAEVGIEPNKITTGITMTEDNFAKWLENQRLRVENGGRPTSNKPTFSRNIYGNADHFDEEIDEPNYQPLDAIILSEKNRDNNTTQVGTGRIIHWKR